MADPLVTAPVPASRGLRDVAKLWWLVLVAGLGAIAVGILALAYPDKTLTAIAVIFGVYLLFAGGVQVGMALADDTPGRGVQVLFGALSVIAGLIVTRHPGESLLVIALAVGIYLVLAGLIRLVGAFDRAEGRGLALVVALIDLAAGVVLVSWPEFGVTSFAVVLGIVLVLRGLGEVLVALGMRRLARKAAA